MRWMIGLLVCVVLFTSISAEARDDSIFPAASWELPDAFIEIPPTPGLVVVYVVVRSWEGLRGIEFSAPIPDDCPGLIYMDATPYGGVITGSLESGLSIDFGECVTEFFPVLAVTFFNTGMDTCCPWGVVAHPNSVSGEIEGYDCDSNVVWVHGEMNTMMPAGRADCGHPTTPAKPSPPDGAVNQPLSVILDWESQPTAGTGLGVFFANVEFGLTTGAPIEFWNIDPPQATGPLLPDTTYYWRVTAIVTDYGSTTGPWWSFRTERGVAVRTSTWGAIKSLYRE